MATQLSILTAVLDGQADALRNLLAALPLRDGSPFAAVSGTHNGRFVVVSPKPLAPRTMLMCSATIDTPIRRWVEGLLDALGPNAEAIWSHCVGWPGLDAAADYLCAHHVVPVAVVRHLGRARLGDRRRARRYGRGWSDSPFVRRDSRTSSGSTPTEWSSADDPRLPHRRPRRAPRARSARRAGQRAAPVRLRRLGAPVRAHRRQAGRCLPPCATSFRRSRAVRPGGRSRRRR